MRISTASKHSLRFIGYLFLLLCIVLIGCKKDNNDDSTDSVSEEIYGVSATIDSSDNVYAIGCVNAGRDGRTAVGGIDVFLVKYSGSGAKQWSDISGTTESDFPESIAASGSGDIYIAGYTYGAMPGQSNIGGADIFLMKFDSDGNRKGIAQTGTASDDYGSAVAVDSSGGVILAGHTYGSMIGENVGPKDLVIMKYDSSLTTRQWIKQLGNNQGDEATYVDGVYAVDLAVDSSDNIYVAGFTSGSLDGNTAIGDKDLFVAKYNSAGGREWVKQYGTVSTDYAEAIAVDGSGNILITGYTYGSMDIYTDGELVDSYTSLGEFDIFVMKLDPNGDFLWTRQIGSTGSDYAYGVVADLSNNVYLAGHTAGALSEENLGGFDQFLIKYDSSGENLLTKQTGTEYSEAINGMTGNQTNSIYVTGYAYQDIDSDGVVEQVLTVIKYNAGGVRQWSKEL